MRRKRERGIGTGSGCTPHRRLHCTDERRESRAKLKRTDGRRCRRREWTRNENYTLQQIRRRTGGTTEESQARRLPLPPVLHAVVSCDVREKETRVILLVRNSEQTRFFATLCVPSCGRGRGRTCPQRQRARAERTQSGRSSLRTKSHFPSHINHYGRGRP